MPTAETPKSEDERDTAVATTRLREIDDHPERMVAGEALDRWLDEVEDEGYPWP